jgi:OmpR-family two-component system manganese-sensing sensor histidine kinase
VIPRDARPLERRVTASYLAAFAVVLAVFAGAVHVAFALDLQNDARARLGAILHDAAAAVERKDGRIRIDDDGVSIVPKVEGVAWIDSDGRIRVAHGIATSPTAPGIAVASAPVILPVGANAASAPTVVRAAVSLDSAQRLLGRVDVGLAVGLIAALAAAGIGGRYLARRAIARVVTALRTLTEFTADAAHELRGPLAALTSNASASLRAGSDLPAEHRRRLETIAATAAQMAHTVDDLLLLARAETPLERELFAVDVAAAVVGAADARRALADERQVALEAHAARARVYGNPSDLDRILGNLLDNALHYTPAGGRVTIACGPERGGVAIAVRDTGVGISPDHAQRIFERFWRADAARSNDNGSGLGLAIVRALARRHGGDVSVRSTPGAGSEFVVWLPERPPQSPIHDFSTIPA